MTKKYHDRLSLPEGLLWRVLKTRPFGLIFRKQHPFGLLKLDFYCAERALAIEVDGISHDMGDRPRRDPRRDAWLRGQGIETMRIAASEVLRNADEAADSIVRYALGKPVVFSAPSKRRRTGPSGPLRGRPPHQDGEE